MTLTVLMTFKTACDYSTSGIGKKTGKNREKFAQRTAIMRITIEANTEDPDDVRRAARAIERILKEVEEAERNAAVTAGMSPTQVALLKGSIDELGLPLRTRNALKAVGVLTVGQVTAMTVDQVRDVPGIGKGQCAVIEGALDTLNLTLKSRYAEWQT
jgi:DNA-directed RNA polymerase alpha subunit